MALVLSSTCSTRLAAHPYPTSQKQVGAKEEALRPGLGAIPGSLYPG